MRTATIGLVLLVVSACTGDSSEDLACFDCVDLEAIGTISFRDAPTFPDVGGIFGANPAGDRRAFVAASTPYEVLVFDGAGDFLGVAGTEGQGPGEFQDVSALAVDQSQALWVVSSGGTRLDVFGPDLELRSSERRPFQISALAPVGTQMAATVATDEEGLVVLLSETGEIDELWSKSAGGSEFPGGLSSLESDGQARVWFTEEYEHEVWEVDLEGEARRLVTGTPDWFEAEFRPDVVQELGGTRNATVVALDFDESEGLLWVISGVPSQDLTAEDLRAMYQDPDFGPEAMYAAMIDHMLEAVDVRTGTLRARAMTDLPQSAATSSPFRIGGAELVEIMRPVIDR